MFEKKEYNKRYRKEHEEEIKEYSKKWRESHQEEIKKYQQEHRKELNENQGKYRQKYPEKCKERTLKWKAENKEGIRKCKREWIKKIRKENPEKVREMQDKNNKSQRIGRKLNPEKYRAYGRKYRKKHPEQVKERKKKDPKFRLDKNIGSYMYLSLRSRKAGRKWQNLVGYTIEDLIQRLEFQFDENMSWKNYGSYWWLEHKKPRSLFRYIYPEEQAFRDCWCLANLQPMERMENMKKSNKFINKH